MTGTRNRHMPTLMTVWKMSIAAMPTQMYDSSGLFARRATRTQRTMIAVSSASASRHPIIPSSSPMVQKMKSVCRAGRLHALLLCVWVPWRYPSPVSFPPPRAIRPRVCCQPTPCGS